MNEKSSVFQKKIFKMSISTLAFYMQSVMIFYYIAVVVLFYIIFSTYIRDGVGDDFVTITVRMVPNYLLLFLNRAMQKLVTPIAKRFYELQAEKKAEAEAKAIAEAKAKEAKAEANNAKK